MMSIMIINSGSGYERLSVEWPFSFAPNLRDVGLNSCSEPRRKWVQLVTASKNDQGRSRTGPTRGWAWTRPSPMEGWVGTGSGPIRGWARSSPPSLRIVRRELLSRVMTFIRCLLNGVDVEKPWPITDEFKNNSYNSVKSRVYILLKNIKIIFFLLLRWWYIKLTWVARLNMSNLWSEWWTSLGLRTLFFKTIFLLNYTITKIDTHRSSSN